MALHQVAGLVGPITLSDDIDFRQSLIPVGLQRPGIPLQDDSPNWIQHETANEGFDTGADMHGLFLLRGAKDQYGNPTQTSFHFGVDGGVSSSPNKIHIRQYVPVDEVTWQAADGDGPGNMDCISCEGCVNSNGNEALMRRGIEELAAQVLLAKHQSADAAGTHWDYNYRNAPSARHKCPNHMMFRDNYIGTWKNNIAQRMHPMETTVFAHPSFPDWWTLKAINTPSDREWKGVRFRYARITYTAINDGVVARATASPTGALTRKPLEAGEEFEGLYRFKSGGKWWIFTKYGSRILASHCRPFLHMID